VRRKVAAFTSAVGSWKRSFLLLGSSESMGGGVGMHREVKLK
jgi:hypothetical protein